MLKQIFKVEHYWKVIVYYNLDYNLFTDITFELKRIGISTATIHEIYGMMYSGKAKAVTFSNIQKHVSVVLFNAHNSHADYLNSIVHEAEHIKQAMLQAYHIEDKGEPPAYTIGYLISQMYQVFKDIICNCPPN